MTPTPRLPPGLDDLLRACRGVGLEVGARELVRLHRAFSRAPALGQDRPTAAQLRRLLTAALVHSPREAELFAPVWANWSERLRTWEEAGPGEAAKRRWRKSRAQAPAQPAPPPSPASTASTSEVPTSEVPATPAAEPRLARRQVRVGARLVLAALALWPPLPKALSPTATILPDVAPTVADDAEAFRTIPSTQPTPPTYMAWTPRITVEAAPPDVAWIFLALGGACWVAAVGLGVRAARRSPDPPPAAPPPSLPGPRRLPYLPRSPAGPQLLGAEAAQTLVWGVGRHLRGEPTPELDLERTARATARRAGLPELRYRAASRLREVWLWLDGALVDDTPRAYAREIADALDAAGLPVRLGAFDGVPLELRRAGPSSSRATARPPWWASSPTATGSCAARGTPARPRSRPSCRASPPGSTWPSWTSRRRRGRRGTSPCGPSSSRTAWPAWRRRACRPISVSPAGGSPGRRRRTPATCGPGALP